MDKEGTDIVGSDFIQSTEIIVQHQQDENTEDGSSESLNEDNPFEVYQSFEVIWLQNLQFNFKCELISKGKNQCRDQKLLI